MQNNLRILLTEEQIQKRVKELAAQITLDRARRMYPGENWGIVALAA